MEHQNLGHLQKQGNLMSALFAFSPMKLEIQSPLYRVHKGITRLTIIFIISVYNLGFSNKQLALYAGHNSSQQSDYHQKRVLRNKVSQSSINYITSTLFNLYLDYVWYQTPLLTICFCFWTIIKVPRIIWSSWGILIYPIKGRKRNIC